MDPSVWQNVPQLVPKPLDDGAADEDAAPRVDELRHGAGVASLGLQPSCSLSASWTK